MDRQKIIIIFGAALLCATLLSWLYLSAARGGRREKTVRVVAARTDLPLGTRIRPSDLKQVEVPEKDLPKGALLDEKQALDRAALYPVSANEPLLNSKLSTGAGAEGIPATIEPGKRAISVTVNDTAGVAGLILPNARVDVLFTRTGTMAEAITTTILQNVRVLAIGRVTQIGQTIDPRAPRMPVATLVVTPEESRKLELAKNQGKISLALRNPLDQTADANVQAVTSDAIDPLIGTRLLRGRRARTPNLNDPRVWQELTGEPKPDPEANRRKKEKEPEKPRLVVDVFRGDKHVQESFR